MNAVDNEPPVKVTDANKGADVKVVVTEAHVIVRIDDKDYRMTLELYQAMRELASRFKVDPSDLTVERESDGEALEVGFLNHFDAAKIDGKDHNAPVWFGVSNA